MQAIDGAWVTGRDAREPQTLDCEDALVKQEEAADNLDAPVGAAPRLQGKYLDTMRGLKRADRAKVKNVRAAKGISAAIRAAERMAG